MYMWYDFLSELIFFQINKIDQIWYKTDLSDNHFTNKTEK